MCDQSFDSTDVNDRTVQGIAQVNIHESNELIRSRF